MIDRYTTPEITSIWSDQNRYKIWLDIERFALEGLVATGDAPQQAIDEYNLKANFDVKRILEIEAEVKHDVIAFLTNVAEYVGPLSRYVHRGMTSNDVVDTCIGVQLRLSGECILPAARELLATIARRVNEFELTPCIGRSHGVHAEPTTFGVKLAGWFAEMKRNLGRLERAFSNVAVGKLSGAVGTFAGINPSVERHVMQKLQLTAEDVATQVVSRDRHAELLSACALAASSIERFAVEIRHLQRTEVREVTEGFSKGQKGSSAMPHKRNPIMSENLSGLARLMRSYAQAALENIPLWHERDISHSSVERVVLPDAMQLMHFIFLRFNSVLSNLVVDTDRMMQNLELTRGTIFSGHLLLALVDNGMVREEAYALVQKHAIAAFDGGPTLKERAIADNQITSRVSTEVLDKIFNFSSYLREASSIVRRGLAS